MYSQVDSSRTMIDSLMSHFEATFRALLGKCAAGLYASSFKLSVNSREPLIQIDHSQDFVEGGYMSV